MSSVFWLLLAVDFMHSQSEISIILIFPPLTFLWIRGILLHQPASRLLQALGNHKRGKFIKNARFYTAKFYSLFSAARTVG